jgi:hypothetical protein
LYFINLSKSNDDDMGRDGSNPIGIGGGNGGGWDSEVDDTRGL